MSTTTRETHLAAMFVALADVVDSDAGVIDILHELALATRTIPGAVDAGILLADEEGRLHVMASTSERAKLIEILQLGAGDGPCIQCFTSGQPVNVDDVDSIERLWPVFHRAAKQMNVHAIHAVPLRLRDTTIGAMNIFSEKPVALSDQDVALAQALADIATIAILQTRTRDRHREVEEQLRFALESRVLIEQAKGAIAANRKIPVDDAFALLRGYARANNAKLHDVARQVVELEISI